MCPSELFEGNVGDNCRKYVKIVESVLCYMSQTMNTELVFHFNNLLHTLHSLYVWNYYEARNITFCICIITVLYII